MDDQRRCADSSIGSGVQLGTTFMQRELEADVIAGLLDALADFALDDHVAGRSRTL